MKLPTVNMAFDPQWYRANPKVRRRHYRTADGMMEISALSVAVLLVLFVAQRFVPQPLLLFMVGICLATAYHTFQTALSWYRKITLLRLCQAWAKQERCWRLRAERSRDKFVSDRTDAIVTKLVHEVLGAELTMELARMAGEGSRD